MVCHWYGIRAGYKRDLLNHNYSSYSWRFLKMKLLTIFALILGSALAQRECGRVPVECKEFNPCVTARCPRFTSTLDCCPEIFDGKCAARFYRRDALRPIEPGRCFFEIEFCRNDTCKGGWKCVEQRFPCTTIGCDHVRIKTSCERRRGPVPIVDSDRVS